MHTNMLRHTVAFIGGKTIVVLLAALFIGSLASGNAFAATTANHGMANSQQTQMNGTSRSIAIPFDCSLNPQDRDGYGYGYLNVPGGTVEMNDYFHYSSCDTATSVNYTFDGNDSTDWSAGDSSQTTQIDLVSNITLNGVGVSVNLPPGGTFNLTSSNVASHTDTVNNTGSDGFTYNGLTGSALAPLNAVQSDAATYHINGQSYQVGTSVTLSA